MRINHNIAALNTYSRLSQANGAQGKSLEKLSSGQRINKAGDDAAGLAISEKMRGQIRGLNQASRNAQDGISMIQTAEGALNETHSILQRMRELSVQAGNDTNTADDRGQIQGEINQLSSEINRIAGTTEFNKQKLLNGGLAANTVQGVTTSVAIAGQDSTAAVYKITFSSCMAAAAACALTFNGVALVADASALCTSTIAAFTADVAATFNTCTSAAISDFTAVASGNTLTLTAKQYSGSTVCGTSGNGFCLKTAVCSSCDAGRTTVYTAGTNSTLNTTTLKLTDASLQEGVTMQIGDKTFGLWDSRKGTYFNACEAANAMGVACAVMYDISQAANDTASEIVALIAACTSSKLTLGVNTTDTTGQTLCVMASANGVAAALNAGVKVQGAAGTAATANNGVTLQIGANASQTFKVTFGDMTGSGINVVSTAAGGSLSTSDGKIAKFSSSGNVENNGGNLQFSLDITNADNATAAVSAIDDAINRVSTERSKLGAYQNRLDHTITNLDTSAENLTAAESRIRDVDMAKEMMEFTKNNILNQAATAMLAQANQQPQGVLQLLR